MNLAGEILAKELKEFEVHFKEAVKSRVSLLDRIMHYIIQRKGKQLRPRFVMLAAKLGGEINDSTYRAASLVELLHTATLVHDDVVDEAKERRGFFSINALGIAVERGVIKQMLMPSQSALCVMDAVL